MRILWALLLTGACGGAKHADSRANDRDELRELAGSALGVLDAKRLEETTKYLASDELQGRGTGTPGGAKAEQYVADQFKAIGLSPAGDDGTFFQTVPLRESTRIDAASSFVVHGATDVSFASDRAVFRGEPREAKLAIDAPLVFVGYGIAQPALGYDDLTGVDLHGAIAVVMGGAPSTINGKPVDSALHAVLADVTHRAAALKAHGAVAVVTVYDPLRALRMDFPSYQARFIGPSLAWLDRRDGTPASAPILPSIIIDEAGFDSILSAAHAGVRAHDVWTKLDRGEHVQMPLEKASLRITSELHDTTARNVIALLPGANTEEVVVYTAHLDHLGIGPSVDGDNIYNGAMDNAIGVAAMLEIARAFKALPHAPPRSILFIATTGEEKLFLGSDYFVEHPTIPLSQIIANLNIDGVTANYEVHDIIALGADHSSLATEVAAATRAVGLAVSPDPDPAQVYFVRSDQYSFVRFGIPATFAAAGTLDAKGGHDVVQAIVDKWGDEHYHRPSDQWRPEYRGEWAIPELSFHFLVGLAIAAAPGRPHWNEGDVFATFAKTPLR